MGWHGATLPVTLHALLDEHGGEKEQRHQAVWDDLTARAVKALQEIAADPKYDEITAAVW